MAKPQPLLDRAYPWLLTIGGTLGLLAAFQLTLEKMALLKDPAHVLSCNINPIVSCGPVITSDQASAFGFPNPMLGLIGFAMVITVGVAMLAGAQFRMWFWRLFHLGTLGGVLFVHWLIFQTVYRLQALCPYCMVVWVVTIPIFFYTILYSWRHVFASKLPSGLIKFTQDNHLTLLCVWYLAIIGLVLQHFWYYFGTVL